MTEHPISMLDEKACLRCGALFRPTNKYPQKRFCSRRCWLKTQHTPEHQSAATRARNVKSRGTGKKHPYVKRDGRHEHRTVAEEKLGRALLPGEVVHHRDENGRNNAPGNLEPLPSQSEHARIHFTGKKHTPEHVSRRMASRAATMRRRGIWK